MVVEKIQIKSGFFNKPINCLINYDKQDVKKPVVFWLHGLSLRKNEHTRPLYEKVAFFLQNAGFAVVRFGFTMAEEDIPEKNITIKEFHINSQNHDLKQVFKYIYSKNEKYNLDLENVTLIGHSFAATTIIHTYPELNKIIPIRNIALLAPKTLYSKYEYDKNWDGEITSEEQEGSFFFPWRNKKGFQRHALKNSFIEKNSEIRNQILDNAKSITCNKIALFAQQDEIFIKDYQDLIVKRGFKGNIILGANHSFNGKEEEVVKNIMSFIK